MDLQQKIADLERRLEEAENRRVRDVQASLDQRATAWDEGTRSASRMFLKSMSEGVTPDVEPNPYRG